MKKKKKRHEQANYNMAKLVWHLRYNQSVVGARQWLDAWENWEELTQEATFDLGWNDK